MPVLRWFLNRLESSGAAEAAEVGEPIARLESPVLQQVEDQLEIAWAGARLERLEAHRDLLDALLAEAEARATAGAATGREVDVVRLAGLQARLAIEDGELALMLAIDHHQDVHDNRLTAAEFPKWEIEPSGSLAAVRDSLAADKHAEARRQLRLLDHARASLALIDDLLPLARGLRDAQRQEVDLGTAGIAELVASEDLLLEVALVALDRQLDRYRAEAWLLAATGDLDERYIALPGWD